MKYKFLLKVALGATAAVTMLAGTALANHSWGGYHWARTANPFNLKLGDNVSTIWDAYLATASTDWSVSSVLDTTIVAGQSTKRNCSPTNGQVEVCDARYGYNGWLGLAQIWASGLHITQGVVKFNDNYFDTAKYNTPAWRNIVVCQEVGHTFGLGHQDELFSNPNLGTCMDYTDDPDGTLKSQLSNEHPNQHDYDELAIIYGHLDSLTTLSPSLSGSLSGKARNSGNPENSAEWGKGLRQDGRGRTSLFEKDLGNGEKLFTFVIWVD